MKGMTSICITVSKSLKEMDSYQKFFIYTGLHKLAYANFYHGPVHHTSVKKYVQLKRVKTFIKTVMHTV